MVTYDDGYSIACPCCGHRHEDLFDYVMDEDEARDVECEACGRTFKLSLRVSYDYTASPIDEPQ